MHESSHHSHSNSTHTHTHTHTHTICTLFCTVISRISSSDIQLSHQSSVTIRWIRFISHIISYYHVIIVMSCHVTPMVYTTHQWYLTVFDYILTYLLRYCYCCHFQILFIFHSLTALAGYVASIVIHHQRAYWWYRSSK
jgi:hypothetical protein